MTLLLGACSADDDSDAQNGGLSPILDEATGWKRIKSLAPLGATGIGRSMEMKTMTRVDGMFAFVDVETRGSQGGPLVDRYYVKFPAADPADVTSMGLGIGESNDYKNYRYTFRPGTIDVYQSFRENRGSEVWSGIRTTGPVTVGELRSAGGDTFAGLADIYGDGTALITGAQLDGALFKDGVWSRIYGRYSDINEPQPFAGYGVELDDHTLAWALMRETDVAVGTLAQNPQSADQQQVKGFASIPAPEGYIASTYVFARPFGNQMVFINATALANATTISAFRWTEGATTIETLYSVDLPSSILLPPVTNNAQFLLHLDVDGTLTFFSNQDASSPTAALIRVDAAGPHTVSTITGDGHTVQGPWLIDGAIYAAVAASSRQDVDAQLDLLQLKQ